MHVRERIIMRFLSDLRANYLQNDIAYEVLSSSDADSIISNLFLLRLAMSSCDANVDGWVKGFVLKEKL